MLAGIFKGAGVNFVIARSFLFGEDEAALILYLKKFIIRVQLLLFDAFINLFQLLRELIHLCIDLAVLAEHLFLEFLSGK